MERQTDFGCDIRADTLVSKAVPVTYSVIFPVRPELLITCISFSILLGLAYPQYHRKVWFGGALKDHLVPTLLSWPGMPHNWIRLHRVQGSMKVRDCFF